MPEEKLRQLTPQEEAEIDANLERLWGPIPIPKPKVVKREDIPEPVRDADVHVSKADVNTEGTDRVVEVRRPDYVTINIPAWEEQQAWKQEEKRRRRELDPYRLGLWGPVDYDD